MLAMVAAFQSTSAAAQDARSDRFGLGPAAIGGWFGSYSGVFVGGEGFVRLARGSFWSVRLDGAYFTAALQDDKINLIQRTGYFDDRRIGKVGTLTATAMLGPSSSNGLRPFYGLVGFGGAATRWGGGYLQNPGGQNEDGVGTGPSFALLELGVGSEFRALLNDRIELRAFRTSPTPPAGNRAALGAFGTSLTIGVVW
jgi:hypothetical protein